MLERGHVDGLIVVKGIVLIEQFVVNLFVDTLDASLAAGWEWLQRIALLIFVLLTQFIVATDRIHGRRGGKLRENIGHFIESRVLDGDSHS